MKRKLAVLLAVIALATAAMAAPVSAGDYIRGDAELALYEYQCPNDSAPGDGFLTWAGTFTVGTKTFGLAYFPAGPLEFIGETGFVYFEEDWTLFRLPRFMWHEDALLWAACSPWRILLEGTDVGVGTPDFTVFAAGEITYGKGHWEKFVGGNSFAVGAYTNAELTEFESQTWFFRGDMK